MAGQLWVTNSLGGYSAAPFLSKEVLVASQPLMRFQQFCVTKTDFGKGKGDTMLFDKIGNLDASGGDETLTETDTVQSTNFAMTQGTLTLNERAKKIPITGKLLALADVDMKTPVIKALKNHSAKKHEIAVEAQMDACKIRYVASTASTGNFTTNGTATLSASVNMSYFHLKEIVDYLMGTLLAPPADGEFYFGICTVKAARGIFDTLESVWQYTQFPVNGEMGKAYKARMVRDTNAMDNAIGVSNVAGEAYFFGEEAVAEGVAIPMEIRTDIVTDLGRSQAFGWYSLVGYKIMWAGDPDSRICKFDSA